MTITVSNLGKRFNREWIFRGLTTEFKAGNIYAITGPNGSGKSTMMHVLWGQVPVSEGVLNYQIGTEKINVEDAFRHVAIAAPYMDLLEDFTLAEHIEFHFSMKGAMNKWTTPEIIEKLDLQAAANKPIKQFSSGMKQRLKLGLALFSESKAIFLDEPTTNLDEAAIHWYMTNLLLMASTKVVFIATNQPTDYPEGSHVLNLSSLKKVTHRSGTGIQPL